MPVYWTLDLDHQDPNRRDRVCVEIRPFGTESQLLRGVLVYFNGIQRTITNVTEHSYKDDVTGPRYFLRTDDIMESDKSTLGVRRRSVIILDRISTPLSDVDFSQVEQRVLSQVHDSYVVHTPNVNLVTHNFPAQAQTVAQIMGSMDKLFENLGVAIGQEAIPALQNFLDEVVEKQFSMPPFADEECDAQEFAQLEDGEVVEVQPEPKPKSRNIKPSRKRLSPRRKLNV